MDTVFFKRAVLAVNEFHRFWASEVEDPRQTIISSCELVDGDYSEVWHAFVVHSECGQEETILVKPRLGVDIAEVVDEEQEDAN